MTLDARSILLTSTAVSFILTAMMLVYRLTRKVYAGFTYWLMGDVFITLGFLLVAMRGILPDFVTVLLGNIFLILALVVLHQGIRRFFGDYSQDRLNVAILIVFSLFLNYFLYVEDRVAMRIVLTSFTLSFLMYRSGALLIFNAPEQLKKSAAPGGVMMWATGAFFFARAVDAITNFSTYDLFSPRLINVLGFMMGAVLVSAWTFGFFFLNSTRLELELETIQAELRKLVVTDYLTGIYNRRYFYEHSQLEFQRAHRYQGSFSILVIDADNFKAINDEYGHAAGDLALQETANTISVSMRSSDICARLGGEEFGVMLLQTDKEYAIETAERIRAQVEQKVFSTTNGKQFSITVSVGVADFLVNDKSIDDVINRADQALYRAKKNGKNSVSD